MKGESEISSVSGIVQILSFAWGQNKFLLEHKIVQNGKEMFAYDLMPAKVKSKK